MRGADAGQQPRDDRMTDALPYINVSMLHGKQYELGNIIDVPFGQCGKCISRFQLLHRQLRDEGSLNGASLELVKHKFAHSRIEFGAALK